MINYESMLEHYLNEYDLVVVLGIPINRQIDIKSIKDSKYKYFLQLMDDRKIIYYEEFLLLHDFILGFFEKIVVVKNNIFINFYPLFDIVSNIDKELIKKDIILRDEFLEKSLNPSIEEPTFEFINLYHDVFADFALINGQVYVNYTFKNSIDVNEKIVFLDLYEVPLNETLSYQEVEESNLIVEIYDEITYIELVIKVRSGNFDDIYVSLDGADLLQEILFEKTLILSKVFKLNCDIHLVKDYVKEPVKIDTEKYLSILKEFWGYDDFRTLMFYDFDKLKYDNKKITKKISQVEIIDEIFNQIVNCNKNHYNNDVFVTAPTGSGKSVLFQLPAILAAREMSLLTIIITPLKGLMEDQVSSLKSREYFYAETMNSDTPPIIKNEIIDKISKHHCHLLYISPETLISKSDLSNLIGERVVGMVVVDEAHIVTTWGKQFRPDYWYLGDHIQYLRKKQLEKKGVSFVVTTFTATAIYNGIEDMYRETKSSLQLMNPKTYLGFIKRSNIDFDIKEVPKETGRKEYEINKFDQISDEILKVLIKGGKILVYFPTVKLIERYFSRIVSTKKFESFVTIYHGKLTGNERKENLSHFKDGIKKVMLATKAFGMGIDIDDIQTVIHFAPTGNVCDFVQEVGRVARKEEIKGKAFYRFMSNDFQHINRLHGLSTIKPYQLVKVMGKILNLYNNQLKENKISKKQNTMLIDSSTFSYIFENQFFGDDSNIEVKVKTALLLIQKDFINRRGFSPFIARPIPLFQKGYFYIRETKEKSAKLLFGKALNEIEGKQGYFEVDLSEVWQKRDYINRVSFPRFKYEVYSLSDNIPEIRNLELNPAVRVDLTYSPQFTSYQNIMTTLRQVYSKISQENKYYTSDELSRITKQRLPQYNDYFINSLTEVLIASIIILNDDIKKNVHGRLYNHRQKNGVSTYQFTNNIDDFFDWIHTYFNKYIRSQEKTLYVCEDIKKSQKSLTTVLGILESWNILSFKMLGGSDSQIYIYINQTQALFDIVSKPNLYKNKILEEVSRRHKMSSIMLKYIFTSKLENNEIWDIIEDYFLGNIPETVLDEFNSTD